MSELIDRLQAIADEIDNVGNEAAHEAAAAAAFMAGLFYGIAYGGEVATDA